MASTNFKDYNQNTPVTSAWLNDVNGVAYTAAGTKKVALQAAAAWVRFAVSGGVATIQQSSNIQSVSRVSAGVYLVTYATPMTISGNCYSMSMTQVGFTFFSSESVNTVTVNTTDAAGNPVDPGFVSLAVFGNN